MAQEFTMPKLGLTMTEGTIREWLVAEGTMVQAGDPVLVIETDKVETEVEARESGVLRPTGAVGENYECGAVIGYLLADGESAAGEPSAAPATQAASTEAVAPEPAAAPPTPSTPPIASPSPVPAAAPVAAASALEVDVAVRGEGGRILASPRARAAARDVAVELAHIAGTGPQGRILADDITSYVARRAAVASQATDTGGASTNGAAPRSGARVLASPRARATARDLGVDLATVSGTGPQGRIVADDVTSHVPPPAAAEATPAASPVPVVATTAPAPASTTPVTAGVAATGGARMLAELLGIDLRAVPAVAPGVRVTREDIAAWVRRRLAQDEPASPAEVVGKAARKAPGFPLLQEPSAVIPLRGMRGVIAERMHGSLTEMAQLTLSIDADMTAVSAERDRRKRADLIVPGFTAWVVAAASRALIDHPCVNSQVTADGVAHLPDVHLGVAVALDEGLIVPVIEHADTRAVDELHAVVAELAGKAREGKLKLNELEGGTFSVTALGMYGVDMFTPVINPPNTAILGVGRLRTETRWNDGVPSPKTVMTLSLTWDHRAFDGAPAAEFAQSIVRYLENPAQLIR